MIFVWLTNEVGKKKCYNADIFATMYRNGEKTSTDIQFSCTVGSGITWTSVKETPEEILELIIEAKAAFDAGVAGWMEQSKN